MANLNLNKVILGGRLTADPELKQTQNGTPVCTFTVAINRRTADNVADFINCIAWRKQAEFLTTYFRKASSVCVVGQVQTRSWTDKNGHKRYATEVLAEEINFVDAKGESEGGNTDEQEADYPLSLPSAEEYANDDDLPF